MWGLGFFVCCFLCVVFCENIIPRQGSSLSLLRLIRGLRKLAKEEQVRGAFAAMLMR